MAYFFPICSGSWGNSGIYVTDDRKILIDAGGNTKTIKNAIAHIGISLKDITDIVITHTHRDHIGALPVLLNHTSAPIHISEEAFSELPDELRERAKIFQAGTSLCLGSTQVNSFKTPHDSFGSVGFTFESENCSKFAFLTDLGHITPEIEQAVRGACAIYIESNHDEKLVKTGPYPYFLKQRILSDVGHISNEICAGFLAKNIETGIKKIILAHLSETNNLPHLALLETEQMLYKMGAQSDVSVVVAQKKSTMPPITL